MFLHFHFVTWQKLFILFIVRLKTFKVLQKARSVLNLTDTESIHDLVKQNCDISISW